MKRHQTAQPERDSDWQETQYANLIRYVPSGKYYAQVRVKGKLIKKALKATKISVAKLRLADLAKDYTRFRMCEQYSHRAGRPLDSQARRLRYTRG